MWTDKVIVTLPVVVVLFWVGLSLWPNYNSNDSLGPVVEGDPVGGTREPLGAYIQPFSLDETKSKLCLADSVGAMVGGDRDGKNVARCVVIDRPLFYGGPSSRLCDALEPPAYFDCRFEGEHRRESDLNTSGEGVY